MHSKFKKSDMLKWGIHLQMKKQLNMMWQVVFKYLKSSSNVMQTKLLFHPNGPNLCVIDFCLACELIIFIAILSFALFRIIKMLNNQK